MMGQYPLVSAFASVNEDATEGIMNGCTVARVGVGVYEVTLDLAAANALCGVLVTPALDDSEARGLWDKATSTDSVKVVRLIGNAGEGVGLKDMPFTVAVIRPF